MTLARRGVTVDAAAAPLSPAPGAEPASPVLARLISGERLIRVAVHIACWVPFIASAADSWRGPWRATGDGARTALMSWGTLTNHIPLVGLANELPHTTAHTPYDLGPMQLWLMAIPVHIDPDRGVLWGAALLAMLATWLTVEAGYSVLGETGGLLAGGVVIATVAWFPSFAVYPYENPNYGMIFFLASLSACLAVLSGHRKWWPVLVVTASMAAQAYLTYAVASVGLVLIAAVTGLVAAFRDKGGYSWLIGGLIAGAACWLAPLDQQFTSPAGQGNMSLLLQEDAGPHVGVGFAMKVLALLTAPSSLWWRENISLRGNLYQLLSSKPTALGFVILAITAASLVIAVCWLRSRELAGLAAISLLVSVTAAATFARIPAQSNAIGGVHRPWGDLPLIFVMFAAALLAWLTVICVTVLAAARLISGRRGRVAPAQGGGPGGEQRVRQHPVLRSARLAGALLIVMTALLVLGVRQVANYQGEGTYSLRVSAALPMIERSVPRHGLITLKVSPQADWYRVGTGLQWALIGDGYLYTTRNRGNHIISNITVIIRPHSTTVRIRLKELIPDD
ncbi:MAG TPA: hypothetical protein VNF47_26390 [Streptosporangiaceae bacterium]|nr:hypothetical protein [Streptosporangiaceae bacterium]